MTGLQYAYANPGAYTVHIITSTNENLIDSLDITANTKANMHTDVGAGKTIVTPDKFVTKGVWSGILYISLAPDWTGMYAIGEQPSQGGQGGQNGGFTSEGYEILNVLIDGKQYAQFINRDIGHPDNFIYTDQTANTTDKLCRISKATFLDIMNNESWQESYGLPCLKEQYAFGTHDHTFIMALNASKFKSTIDGYSYWRTDNFIRARIAEKSPDANVSMEQINPYWGTYVFGKKNDKKMVIYNPQQMIAHNLEGKMYEKYVSENKIIDKYVPELLGFPTSDEQQATPSFADTRGTYQNFTVGQLYFKDSLLPWREGVFVVFGKMAEYYNKQEHCRTVDNEGPFCGTGGIFGFPTSDPFQEDGITQEFEEANIMYNVTTGAIVAFNQTKEGRRLQNKEYGRKMVCYVMHDRDICRQVGLDIGVDYAPLITDVEAFAKIVDYLAKRTNNNDDFVKDLTLLLTGGEKIDFFYGLKSKIHQIEKKLFDSPYDIDGFSDTGFKFHYNDSHYCVDPFLECVSNQLFHSMLGFNYAFFNGKEAADRETVAHDKNSSPLSVNSEKLGINIQDIWLGMRVSEFGEALKNKTKQKEEMGTWMLNTIAVSKDIAKSDYDYLRTTRDEEIALGEYKKKFRILEYQLNGNVHNKWWYNADIKSYNCSQGKRYYQDYEYLFVNGENKGDAKAVWDDEQKKMLVLYQGLKDEYNTEEKICQNLSQLTNQYGISLTLTFNEMLTEICPDCLK